MTKIEPKILPGFLELLPNDQILFNKMLDTIKKVYESYGFIPLDTPEIELTEVLLAKCGGETAKQTYSFKKGDNDLSLRFDLTIPLARYTAMHYNDLSFPFRRYHVGKVFRGEKPQRGRFREFYQCDIDIIGNGELSILNDAEMPSVIYNVFKKLGFDNFTIRFNNRKLLNGFFESLDIEDKVEVLRIIDKIAKIGVEKVKKELLDLGVNEESIEKIISFISIDGTNEEILDKLGQLNIENELFKKGLEELRNVEKYIKFFGVPKKNYKIDITIARGLDYYTGTVYETFLDEHQDIGSICSGGRYDNLAGYYSNNILQGVGVSIGLSRLFWQLREAKLIQSETSTLTKVLIVPMTENIQYCIEVVRNLRENGIIAEIYLEEGKAKKKFGYADKLGIPYTIAIGDDEITENIITLKDMKTGEQSKESVEEIVNKLK